MKKGFISMTIIYSFLLLFIFTLLALLVLYTQKSRLVDTIVYEAKETIEKDIYNNTLAACFTLDDSTIIEYKCSDDNVSIPARIEGVKVTAIGADAFRHMGIDSVKIPSTITTIGDYAFAENGIETLRIPSSVRIIGEGAFEENSINRLTIETSDNIGLESIGSEAFAVNELWSVTIPSTVKNIYGHAFYHNPMEEVIIEGKTKAADFNTYSASDIWEWSSSVTCVTNNNNNVPNGCIIWGA